MTIRFSRHVMDKLATELSRKGITEELLRDAVRSPDEILFIITAIHSSRLDEVVCRRKRSGRWI